MENVLIAIAVAMLFAAVCFGLFKCGQWIGEGVVLLKGIESRQMKEFEKRLTVGPGVVNSLKRIATIRILGPFLVLCILYSFIAVEFGVIAFLGSLPSLFIVRLGSKRVNVSKLLMY